MNEQINIPSEEINSGGTAQPTAQETQVPLTAATASQEQDEQMEWHVQERRQRSRATKSNSLPSEQPAREQGHADAATTGGAYSSVSF